MAELRFEWDPKKAAENRRKHGVSLEEAESVFVDEFAILLDVSAKLFAVVVSHCYRKEDDVVRLISARKATRWERDIYQRRWRRWGRNTTFRKVAGTRTRRG